MNITSRPFRINIGFILNQPVGTLREIPFELPAYDFEDDFSVRNLKGSVSLARTYNGIRALANLTAEVDETCGRCLEPYNQNLHAEFEVIFTFENHPLSEEEETIREDGNIDFEELIREYLILDMPYKPICRPDCKGLCIECGQNLNQKDCGHLQVSVPEEKNQPETSLD